MSRNLFCANCRKDLSTVDCTGESGIYSPNRPFELCEPCWNDEDKMIDETGTNDHPELIEKYKTNVKLTATRRQAFSY